ncbi:proto-oncogene tyrosine-protein kinase ROS isoform X1 [Pygocentrus nattereri]|uniref:proto-oncogene tyrosine-protein kinase ROS isoform X1 n=1 Tax=Pygocentrus nattereri TaxID=42514 RepID=UPI0018912FDB|nr:proto-oncogene tyrosine-protein kinase ROS isoform X1 [Pygocentrus nattereri]
MDEIWRRTKAELGSVSLLTALLLFLICIRPSSAEDHAQTPESSVSSCDQSQPFGPPSAPYTSRIGSHSITLSWTPLNCTDVLYIPQWTGPRQGGVWTQKENVREPTYTVENLQPFSLYKFRIWAVVSETYTCSPESPLYRTEPFGVPSSPVIERAESTSGESVEVSWSTPESPGGIIVGYNLNLTAQAHVITVTTGGDVFRTLFYPTLHNTTYRFSIAAVNREGQGAPAMAYVTTPARMEQSGGRWVFASRLNSLRRHEENADFFAAADCLSDPLIERNITGVAVYQDSNQVYFSEGNRIWEKGAGNLTDLSDLRLIHLAQAEVTALSVDWLYRKLYYISNSKIYMCELDDCSSAVDFNLSLASPPKTLTADPYNGWLFLLLQDGIHRVSLPEGFSHTANLTHVVKMDSLSDFVVSFPNRRLVFYNRTDHTLSTVSLDGSMPITLFSEIDHDAQSLAYEDGLLVLTDGEKVYKETQKGQVAIFVEFSMDCSILQSSYRGYGNLCFSSPSSQPCPLPRRPKALQVLFGSDKAAIRWTKPEIANETSPSAWQNWTYSVRWSANGVFKDISNITATHTTVPDLQSNQSYFITVWASSPGGHSQSVGFEGTTLQPVDDIPFIAAVSEERLWRQEMDSFFLQSLASTVKDVKDMDWYNGTVYWTDSSGHISWMELDDVSSGPEVFIVPQTMKADAVAFDWLGQYLYWSCNTNMICRAPKSGQEAEVFLITSWKIESLLIDSPNAAISWSTETTVEVCRLDGDGRVLLRELSVFSGRKIAGVTADLTESILYWLEQDGSFLHLYRADISSVGSQDSRLTVYLKWSSSEVLNQQLAYYSERLVWLGDDGKLRIQEVNQNQTVLMSPDNTVAAFTLLQPTLKPLPGGFVSPPVVIPPAVSKASIRLEGNESAFTILWEPSSTEFGTVFYCVVSNDPELHDTLTAKVLSVPYCPLFNTFPEPFMRVKNFKPNSKISITITPFTYWGKGGSTSQLLLTPSIADTPSAVSVEMIVLSAIISVLTVLMITVGVIIFSRRRQNKAPETNSQTSLYSQDRELDDIRGLVGLGNACYAVSLLPMHKELESLPVFPRECLKLQKLLGSGAFGEVYEGVTVRDPHSDTVPEQRVAVKTLRNGASSQEKIEFLKEAHLMSQFSHPNILRLLGVCVRNEPHYIILELMEGGDLRSYLRGARPTNNHGKLLNLTGLLDISVDVANGCVYLEKLHFVHRDLAARNCLVSVRGYADPDRVIKIGDFGLARDVYKSDYYRKRGEGLLPVRWMPPESLTDGIFNKHSDVWAFGVLLWEIMTLGKQPYPAFSNQEVLHHVNTRGRLPAPAECPQSLYKVMLECWSKEPRERPSFRSLHMSLVKLRETETLSEEGKTGHVNEAYTEDEEEECRGVDADEGLGSGLTHVLSNEGLNYLMYRADGEENTATSSSSSPTDYSPPTEDG